MGKQQEIPLKFHESFDNLIDTFRIIMTSATWLYMSIADAKKWYKSKGLKNIIELECSVSQQKVKVNKSIFEIIEKENKAITVPLYSQSLINFYRIFTIAVKDIIWQETVFDSFRQKNEVQFLYHLRNASAHNNKFFWGKGKTRQNTLKKLPISWRGKNIDVNIEGKELYFDFMKPGDIFILLSDISFLSR